MTLMRLEPATPRSQVKNTTTEPLSPNCLSGPPGFTCWIYHHITVSNSLDPDQALHSVRLDLGPNCLQKLSADDISKQRAKLGVVFRKVNRNTKIVNKVNQQRFKQGK